MRCGVLSPSFTYMSNFTVCFAGAGLGPWGNLSVPAAISFPARPDGVIRPSRLPLQPATAPLYAQMEAIAKNRTFLSSWKPRWQGPQRSFAELGKEQARVEAGRQVLVIRNLNPKRNAFTLQGLPEINLQTLPPHTYRDNRGAMERNGSNSRLPERHAPI